MTATAVSVIVVSRHRPEWLRRCLLSLHQQDHDNFEIVVVADPATLSRMPSDVIKTVAFDDANISAARNAGISAAAGDIIAFIDDDACAEPTWLSRLCAPFQETPELAAAGGFVRGRNGISLQWAAGTADAQGFRHPLHVDPVAPSLHQGRPGHAIRTEGTNCAFRRSVLAPMGGFDPAFRFYLDETDVNMRLAEAGHTTAIVPLAQVHHGFAESARRRTNRVPTDLTDIGASSVVFFRKHGPAEDDIDTVRSAVLAEQHQRLHRLFLAGKIKPRDTRKLLNSLLDGFDAGARREIAPIDAIGTATSAFLRYPSRNRPGRVIAGRWWQWRRLASAAKAAVERGDIVTVLRLSMTAMPHRMWFHDEGYWVQRGGLFGRSDRAGRRFRLTSFAQRVREETRQLAAFRPVDGSSRALFESTRD